MKTVRQLSPRVVLRAVPGASTVNYTTAANIANSTVITLRPTDGKFTLLSNISVEVVS